MKQPPKNIVISHVYSRDNKGDAALTSVLIKDLRRKFPAAALTMLQLELVQPNGQFEGVPERPSFMYYVANRYHHPLLKLVYALYMMSATLAWAAWRRYIGGNLYLPPHLKAVARAYEQADLIVPVGGGYLRGRKGLLMYFNVPLLLHPLLFGYLLGKPTVLNAQSVGPFVHAYERLLVAFVLKRMTRVLLREDTSVALLAKLGATSNVSRAVDSGFLLKATEKIDVRKLYQIPASKLLVGVTVRSWLEGEAHAKYEKAVARALDRLIETSDAHIVFIPQVTAIKGDDDRAVSRRVHGLMQRTEAATVISDAPDHHRIKAIYDNLDLLLGTRFHSVIFSLTSYVPVLAIEYEHKTSGIMHDLKLDEWVIKIEDVDGQKLNKLLQKLVHEQAHYRAHLREYMPPYLRQAQKTADLLADSYFGSGPERPGRTMRLPKPRSYLKKIIKNTAFFILIVILVLGFIKPSGTHAATTPSLGAAASYGVLSSTYTNTSASTINGDVGFTTGPAVPPGGIHNNYGSGPPYATAGTDQASALAALDGQACDFNLGAAIDLSSLPQPLAPGVYCSTGAMSITTSITLNGSGTFIFRADGALNTAAGTVVSLTGGASACDVFWTPTGATTLGANTTFIGTDISNPGITVGANTTWTGRALAFGGTVTTDTTTITVPTCPATLRVVKQMVNNNGGTAVASDFNVHVTDGGVDVVGSPAAGTGSPGTAYSLAAGTYNVSEDANASYAQSFSGDCDASGNITLAASDNLTCAITNDDLPASINVVKTVINDNGRSNVVADFPLFVNGTPVTSGATNTFVPGAYAVTETTDPDYTQSFSGDCDASGNLSLIPGDNKFCIVTNDDVAAPVIVPPVPPLIEVVKVPSPLNIPTSSGSVTYTYTLHNIGTVTATNITMVGDSCTPLALVSGDTNSNAQLEVSETWTYTCTTTLSATHTNNVVATGLANGITATDIASAMVVVGSSAVPPLIHVTKIPNPLTMPYGGGTVTYTEKITNPGTEPLSNVSLTDDKCSPLSYISGDTNSDTNLDPTETWIYTCTTSLSQTTTNTAIASGQANGLTARDLAIATVIVGSGVPAVPGLPNTGANP